MQLLAYALDARPDWSLTTLRDILIQGGRDGGYQLDSLAVDAAVRIVTRVLADHRGVLREPACLTALRESLDVFVEAGWPKAHRLVYRVASAFR